MCVYINVKDFFFINLMVERVGNIVHIFNRRPIVFKKFIIFLRAFFKKIVPSCCSSYKTFPSVVYFCAFYQNVLD